MNRYKIYCTEEQTYKALELGAPITMFSDTGYIPDDTAKSWNLCKLGSKPFVIPTAEEMIGWLEEQEGIRTIDIYSSFGWHYRVKTTDDYVNDWIKGVKNSRQEVTLSAIDAALDYLSKRKK